MARRDGRRTVSLDEAFEATVHFEGDEPKLRIENADYIVHVPLEPWLRYHLVEQLWKMQREQTERADFMAKKLRGEK